MAPARPLRDVFTELTGTQAGSVAGTDPERLLAAAGHPDLPAGLVAEAVVNYADTAAAEVAEHLAQFVMAHGPVPPDPDSPAAAGPAGWLDVLASVPDVLDAASLPEPHEDAGGDGDSGDGAPEHDPFTLDFGGGAGDDEPAAGHDDLAGHDAYAQPPFDAPAPQPPGPTPHDDPAALDGLDAPDGLDGPDDLDSLDGPGAAATGPDTVDYPAGG